MQLIEKGGLAKKMLAMDVLLRLAVLSVGSLTLFACFTSAKVQVLTQLLQLFAPTHRVLVASGVLEALLAQVLTLLALLVYLYKSTPRALCAPTHRVLVAAGVIEALLAEVSALASAYVSQ